MTGEPVHRLGNVVFALAAVVLLATTARAVQRALADRPVRSSAKA